MQEQLQRQQLPAHRRERDGAGQWEWAKQGCFLTGFRLLGAEVMKEKKQLKSCRKAAKGHCRTVRCCPGQPSLQEHARIVSPGGF